MTMNPHPLTAVIQQVQGTGPGEPGADGAADPGVAADPDLEDLSHPLASVDSCSDAPSIDNRD